MCFINVDESKKEKDSREVTERTSFPGELWVQSEAELKTNTRSVHQLVVSFRLKLKVGDLTVKHKLSNGQIHKLGKVKICFVFCLN